MAYLLLFFLASDGTCLEFSSKALRVRMNIVEMNVKQSFDVDNRNV